MKNIAIAISFGLIGLVGLLILKPHSFSNIPPNKTMVNNTSIQEITPETVTTVENPQTTPVVNPSTKPQASPSKPIDTTNYYTTTTISTHASTQSCWSIINGKVYDLTSWINKHPGGVTAIKRLCGVDGSQDFMDQHGGQSRPERELASFFIGVLK